MDRLPPEMLRQIVAWLPLADVARVASASRALCEASYAEVSREAAARDGLRIRYGRALRLSPDEARRACATCEVCDRRPYGTLLAWLHRARCAVVHPPLVHKTSSWTGIVPLAGLAAQQDALRCVSASTVAGASADIAVTVVHPTGQQHEAAPEAALALLEHKALVRVHWTDTADAHVFFFVATRHGIESWNRAPTAATRGRILVQWRLEPLGNSPCSCGSAPCACRWSLCAGCLLTIRAGGDPDPATRSEDRTWADGLRAALSLPYDLDGDGQANERALCAHIVAHGMPLSALTLRHLRR